MMGTEIFKIDASWAEKLKKTRVSFLTAPTVNVLITGETRDGRVATEYRVSCVPAPVSALYPGMMAPLQPVCEYRP